MSTTNLCLPTSHLFGIQIQIMNQIMARQNNAIMSLIKLQGYGITENEIINVEEFLIRARFANQNSPILSPS